MTAHLEAKQDHLSYAGARIGRLIEIRGLGIRRCDFTAEAIVGLVVDLGARMPSGYHHRSLLACVHGVNLPRIPVGRLFGTPSDVAE